MQFLTPDSESGNDSDSVGDSESESDSDSDSDMYLSDNWALGGRQNLCTRTNTVLSTISEVSTGAFLLSTLLVQSSKSQGHSIIVS